jgi:biotin carboxyl carrier protein
MLKATVNKIFTKSIDPSELKELELSHISNNKIQLRYHATNYKLEIVESNFNAKTYQIKINGNNYHVNLADELAIKIAEMGFENNNSKKMNNIIAPMPGLILNISVKEGQKVKNGDVLLVLEAMKMENSITSPKDGIVKLISTEKGTTVEKGQQLIELS